MSFSMLNSIRNSNTINSNSSNKSTSNKSSNSSNKASNSNNKSSNSNKSISKDKKENNNTTLTIICSLIIIILICIAICHSAFKNGLLTCDHYVLNTYLYILLSVFIIYLIVLINDKTGIFNGMIYQYGLFMAIVIFIVFLFLIYMLHKIPPQEIFKSNFVWLLLIILLGILIIPIIDLGRMTGVLGNAGLYTCIIVIITGLLGYYKGDYIVRFDWDYYLYIGVILWAVISIIGFICIYIYNPSLKTVIMFIYIMSIISLIIFVLLLLSVHKTLKENADKCINGNGTVIPNYPTQSFTIIIKIYNIFENVVSILGARKLMSRTGRGRR